VDLLVNNAGIGMGTTFASAPVADHDRMLRVNARAVLLLCHAAVTSMTARGGGGVINVSSVAGFVPGARTSATYGATKAFVIALTEGLAGQLAGTGVRVSVVCPGFVHTELHQRAGIDMSRLPDRMWLDADAVVDAALRDHRTGKVVSVPGAHYKAIIAVTRLVPRKVLSRAARAAARRTS
jgi:short-subunit dehydrogenase